MSLADELLADLEDDVDNSELEALEKEDDEVKPKILELMETDVSVATVGEICKLRASERLKNILEQIDYHIKNPRNSSELIGNVEQDPEYQLIVTSNNLTVDIENEISVIHKFIKDKYQKRFPELDSLVPTELDYIRTVKELKNDLEQVKNNEALQVILTQATIMIVSVTASTTQGIPLSDLELQAIDEACQMAVELNEIKTKIFEYVESRMTFIAPNLSAIVGPTTAAKLVGLAGGLTKLSKMPSCNVQVLGSQKRILSGFSRVATLPHTGFVYFCDVVQEAPPDLRRKAAKLVAAKSTLAARVDACHQAEAGQIGRQFREEIERKLDKLQEPPPVKFIKPLPKPIEVSKKKRGGRRVRKMKERYALTELRKQANRMNFCEIEEDAYQEDLGYSRGTIGKTGTGRIRLPQIDEKTKVRISKTLQKSLAAQKQVWGGSTTVKKMVSGTASSVAFTPLQGLEIVNPHASETESKTEAKYFSNTSGFLSVKK